MEIQIKNDKKINPEMVDAVKEQSRHSMHRKVRRVYDKGVACFNCKKPLIVANTVIGYCCRHCGKYQNAEEAHQRYENGEFYYEDKSSKIEAPAVVGANTDRKEYSMFRDEMEIRADMFINDKTRANMGVEKYSNELKKNLVKNRCYRGPDKVGI